MQYLRKLAQNAAILSPDFQGRQDKMGLYSLQNNKIKIY